MEGVALNKRYTNLKNLPFGDLQTKSNMVLHYSDALLQTQDPNGGKFGDWITKKNSFNVSRRLCKTNICIKEGEKALSKHSATAKHRKARVAKAGSGNLLHVFAAQDAKQKEERSIEDKAKEAEIMYLHHVEAHGIPPHVAECTTQLFKDMFTNSKIAQKFRFFAFETGIRNYLRTRTSLQ